MAPGTDGEADDSADSRWDVETLGTTFGKCAWGFAAAFWVSAVGLLLAALAAGEGRDQQLNEPYFLAALGLFAVCYLGMTVSVFAYGGWSFWKHRRLRRETADLAEPSPFKSPVRLFRLTFGDTDEMNEYEQHVHRTVAVLAIGVFLASAPFWAVFGSY